MSAERKARVADKAAIEQIVFDLDDTLLDTYRQLVPRATRDACVAMVREGLNTDIETCVVAARERESAKTRSDLFTGLVTRFGVMGGQDLLRVATAGSQAFYNRNVESDITLFPGALNLLRSLKAAGYHIHLVTQGHRPTQAEKVRILGIEKDFDSVHLIDPFKGERKRDAFAAVMRATGARPEHHLSVGNRIDTDIAEAKDLGWKTCWVRYGEHRHQTPARPSERPDYMIESLGELVATCQL